VDRLVILAPALAGVAFVAVMFGVYCVMCATGRTPVIDGLDRRRYTDLFGPFLTRYILWLIRPVERALLAANVSPNMLTSLSLAGCGVAGVLIATNHLASATWAYALAGILDILDGRLARATGKQSVAGALFDSVADRWGEIFVFTGCAWYLHDSPWLFSVMAALGGSMMVSYTRARGEGLGLRLDGGTMQRAERIVLVSLGALIAAWLEASPSSDSWGEPALGIALCAVGAASTFTAVGRWIEGYRVLAAREAATLSPPAPIVPLRPARPEPAAAAAAAAQAQMRITGEHTA
jgi:CDP-diacylglycerol--glycerol-3-phosphate 3-phosphatidyltransferase